jgi:hypothetical protein
MTAVLHTHSRRLDYHPHVHIIVPGACLNRKRKQWKKLKRKYLFNEFALAKVFRARILDAVRHAGFSLPANLIYRKHGWLIASMLAEVCLQLNTYRAFCIAMSSLKIISSPMTVPMSRFAIVIVKPGIG